MATEADKYEGFRQKLENICDENGLLYTFSTEGYPITLTISPQQGIGAQISMLEMAEDKPFNSPDARIQFFMEDGDLIIKTSERFTLSEALFTKLKNLFLKMHFSFLQMFHRDVTEKDLLRAPYTPAKGGVSNGKFAEKLEEAEEDEEDADADGDAPDFPDDLLFPEDTPPESGVTRSAWLLKASAKYVRETGKCVLSDIQKKFTLGYAEAARLISELADLGVVGEPTEGGGREVLPFEEVSEDD